MTMVEFEEGAIRVDVAVVQRVLQSNHPSSRRECNKEGSPTCVNGGSMGMMGGIA